MSNRNKLAGKEYGKGKRIVKQFGEKKEINVVYVAHPVKQARKAELRGKGRIIDVLQAPDDIREKYIDDLQAEDKPAPKAKAKKAADDDV